MIVESLDYILNEASNLIKNEFNLKIKKSKLKVYSTEEWNIFCEKNNFDMKSYGMYIPKSYTAYVKKDSPHLISDIFHEYFGHGLFCEYSNIGIFFYELLENNMEINTFLYEKKDFGLCSQNIFNYEGFALWIEKSLCNKLNKSYIWELKEKKLSPQELNLINFFENSEKKLSSLGFMSQLGFPKFYDNIKLLDLISRFYDLNNVDFIINYGSKKPESDIDFFIVSKNKTGNLFNGWLDIYEVNEYDFIYWINNFDISITDPIFSGNLIFGNKEDLIELQNYIKLKKITEYSINFNYVESQKQLEYLKKLPENNHFIKNCKSYYESFKLNAENLKKGIKKLTYKELFHSNTG